MNQKNNRSVRRLTFSAVCLALALLLPFLTGQMQEFGKALAPMHLPVLLCGFVCGPVWGGMVGFIAPLLRFALFGMPPLLPMGVSMAFELAVYGIATGLLYRLLPKKNGWLYPELLLSMLLGRLVWGAARLVLAGMQGTPFGMEAFWAGAVTTAIPGIILQIVLVPLLVMALKKGGYMQNG